MRTLAVLMLTLVVSACSSAAPAETDVDVVPSIEQAGTTPASLGSNRPQIVPPNSISAVALKVDGPYVGNIVKFDINGHSYASNPKCVVSVRYDRAPSALHPLAASFVKEFTVATIPSTLETLSLNEGGAWKVQFRPVHDCTGSEYLFDLTVLPSDAELEPKIYGLNTPGDQAFLVNGQSGQITVLGKGDLSNCQLELSLSGPVANAGVSVISMNGQLSYQQPFTVSFPPGMPSGIYASVNVSVKPVAGCTLTNPNVENKLTSSFHVWTSF